MSDYSLAIGFFAVVFVAVIFGGIAKKMGWLTDKKRKALDTILFYNGKDTYLVLWTKNQKYKNQLPTAESEESLNKLDKTVLPMYLALVGFDYDEETKTKEAIPDFDDEWAIDKKDEDWEEFDRCMRTARKEQKDDPQYPFPFDQIHEKAENYGRAAMFRDRYHDDETSDSTKNVPDEDSDDDDGGNDDGDGEEEEQEESDGEWDGEEDYDKWERRQAKKKKGHKKKKQKTGKKGHSGSGKQKQALNSTLADFDLLAPPKPKIASTKVVPVDNEEDVDDFADSDEEEEGEVEEGDEEEEEEEVEEQEEVLKVKESKPKVVKKDNDIDDLADSEEREIADY